MNRTIFGIAAIFAVALVIPATATAQSQSKAQQNCINALNKAGAKVAATQGKQNSACIKNAGKGKEEAAQDCLSADNKLKVMKAKAKTTAAAETKKCTTESPDFGHATVDEINTAAMDEEVALTADVFGSDLTAAIIPAATSKEAAACQAAISKAYEKLAKAKVKSFVKCKKAGLKEGTILSAADLEDCVAAVNSDSKVASEAAKVTDAVTKKCDGLDLDATFPGDCVGALDFGVCVDERVECRVCLMLDAMDNLAVDCDLFDNGVADMSCATSPSPSTTSTTTTSTTTTTLQLSCSVEQPCPGGVECCGGTCLPPDGLCSARCSVTTDEFCSSDADCGLPNCTECWVEDPNQTCVQGIIVPNQCGGGTCLTSESCCNGSSCCRNDDEVFETCSSGVCQPSCRFGTFACGIEVLNCCANAQLCQSGVCKTSCGPTSCFPDTETCCGDVCCDTATQICGPQPGTCVARQTCTGSDVYIPSLDICCAQGATCGDSACCVLALEDCDTATNQCVSKL